MRSLASSREAERTKGLRFEEPFQYFALLSPLQTRCPNRSPHRLIVMFLRIDCWWIESGGGPSQTTDIQQSTFAARISCSRLFGELNTALAASPTPSKGVAAVARPADVRGGCVMR
jgi:hypothetical protein